MIRLDKKRLFLIDAHGLAYRAYFALPGLSNSKGEVTNAVYGFTMMLQKLLKEEHPEFIAVAFDSKAPTFRHKTYPEYKAQRARMPDDFCDQIPIIHEVVKAYNICPVLMDGYEADDLIGTMAKRFKDAVDEVVVVTADKDMFQLVDDKIRVMATKKGLSDTVIYDKALVEDHFGVPPEGMVDLLGLMGDSSDNIPGVAGIGPKKAQRLIQEFKTIENILSNLDKVEDPNDRERLSSSREAALLSKSLVTIDTACPLELELDGCRLIEGNTEKLRELFAKYEFKSLLKTLEPLRVSRDIEEKIVKDKEGLRELIEGLKKESSLAIDLERDKGLAIGLEDERGVFYLPFEGKGGLPGRYILRALSSILRNPSIAKFGYNLKDTLTLLSQYRVELRGIGFDVGLAAFLLNPSLRNPKLEDIVLTYLGERLDPDSPFERVVSILRLVGLLDKSLKEKELTPLFEDIELKLIPVLARMEEMGVKIDVEYLARMSFELGTELQSLEEEIYKLAGTEFNINSPKQLSHILFEKLSLKPIKRTKTGYSTDEEVLRALAAYDELPKRLLSYRELSKLKSTYIDALPKLVNSKTWRLHTSYSQTTTATGRLASSSPNLQNIPIRTDLGRRIRTAFVPEDEGWLFLSGDYSQIELRILAHISNDENLGRAFREGKDIHSLTASWVFGLKEDEVTREIRRQAKVINFGIIYGMSSYGLAKELGVSPEEAGVFIDKYFEHYDGVKGYIERVVKEAEGKGYVVTLWGRQRPLPDINSKNRNLKEMAKRAAINTPIQGSAADLIKLAMIRIHDEIKRRGLASRMILQVHDELLFEVDRKEEEEVREMVVSGMEAVGDRLSVPIEVAIETGNNWGEIH